MKTQTEIIETLESSIIEMVRYEINQNNLDTVEDIEDAVNDGIFELIDGMQEVIYTYKAKEISEIIGIYDAFDESDFSGERFEDWSQVAFANIYQLICDEMDIMGMVETMVETELNKEDLK